MFMLRLLGSILTFSCGFWPNELYLLELFMLNFQNLNCNFFLMRNFLGFLHSKQKQEMFARAARMNIRESP